MHFLHIPLYNFIPFSAIKNIPGINIIFCSTNVLKISIIPTLDSIDATKAAQVYPIAKPLYIIARYIRHPPTIVQPKNHINNIYEILNNFIEMLNMKIILMDKDSVVYSNVVNVNTKLEGSIKSLVKNGTKLRNHTNEMMIGEQKVKGIYNMIPIITKEGIEGSLIVFGDVNDHSYELCEVLSKIIMLEINIA